MDSSEYLKYMTEKVVIYLDKDNQTDEASVTPIKKTREHWLVRWFGVIPLGIMMWWGRKGIKEDREEQLSVK